MLFAADGNLFKAIVIQSQVNRMLIFKLLRDARHEATERAKLINLDSKTLIKLLVDDCRFLFSYDYNTFVTKTRLGENSEKCVN